MADVEDYGSWTYQSVITAPGGISVDVTVTVPITERWKDADECAELAQMAASRAVRMVRDSKERAPF